MNYLILQGHLATKRFAIIRGLFSAFGFLTYTQLHYWCWYAVSC